MRRLILAFALALFAQGAAAQFHGSPSMDGAQYNGWTTSGRPSSPTPGQTGYNSTLGTDEWWNGSAWVQPLASVPMPTATTLGGIESAAPQAHQWISYIDTGGVPHLAQPSAADISGLGSAATVNTGTSGATIGLLNGNNTHSGAETYTGSIGFSGAGTIVLPSWSSAPANTIGLVGYNATTGRFDFGIGTGVVNHVRLSGDTMTGALHMGANTIDGSAAAFTGGTLTGLTFSGGTLSGTIAGSPTFSGAVTHTSTIKSQSLITMTSGSTIAAQVGSNTAGNTLQLNGASSSSPVLELAVAGVKQHHLQMDSSGDLQAYTYDNTGSNAVKWLQVTGGTGAAEVYTPLTFGAALSLTPGTLTWSGSDPGTPGSTMAFYMNQGVTGSTSNSAIALGRMAIFDNLNATGGVSASTAPEFKLDYELGGTSFQGGRSGLQINVTTPSDMPANAKGSTLVAFQPRVFAGNNTDGGPPIEAINSVCVVTAIATGYTSNNTCDETDSTMTIGASPIGRVWLKLLSSSPSDGFQGYSTDADLVFQGAPLSLSAASGRRNLMLFGGSAAPINPFNGAIMSTMFQAQANSDNSAMRPIAGVFGFNLSSYAASDSLLRWPGGRLENGEADLGYLRIYQGASGPIIDATEQCVISLTWGSRGGYVATEQVSDRFGGNLVIDTVNGSGVPQTWHWAGSQPPCLRAGQTVVVARGMTHSPSLSGGTLLNAGVIDVAAGDTVIVPTSGGIPSNTTVSATSGGTSSLLTAPSSGAVLTFSSTSGVADGEGVAGYCIPAGDTVVSHTGTTVTLASAPLCTMPIGVTAQFLPFVTLSAALTNQVAANQPLVFELTGIPANPVQLVGGSGAAGTSGSANYTWGSASQIAIGGSVPVSVGGGTLAGAAGEVGLLKISDPGTAPGASEVKVTAEAGTTAGTCKIVVRAGTSATPVTLVDNVGSGC